MSKDAWLSSCVKTIQNFVERSTRLQADVLDLRLEEYLKFDFQIDLSLSLEVQSTGYKQAGRVHANENTLVFFNKSQYSQALKMESSTVLLRRETLPEVRSLVLSKPYGHIHSETVIYSHPKYLCLTENCHYCHGHGHINCYVCHGSGKVFCTYCSGSGHRLKQRRYYDHYSKMTRDEGYYTSCSHCYGSGKVNCNSCAGSGNKICEPCQGSGEITTITQLHSIAKPEYQLVYFTHDVAQFIKDGLYKTGLPNLEQAGNIELHGDSINDTERKANFRYNATVPFARLNSPMPKSNNHEIKWIVYGVTPHILDAGHIIGLMLKNDLNQLVYQSTICKLFNPFIGSTSRQAIKTFMESEAHQQMLEANGKGVSGEMLREKLNRSFTIAYLDEALTSLLRIVTAIQRWSIIKWSIFSALLIYILTPAYTAYNHQWKRDAEKIYMTPYSNLNSSQDILNSLKSIIYNCGLFIIIMAAIIPVAGYIWRRIWIRYRLDKHLSKWSISRGILRQKWFKSLCLTIVLVIGLLLINPVWTMKDGMLFGKFSALEQIKWLFETIQQLRSYLN